MSLPNTTTEISTNYQREHKVQKVENADVSLLSMCPVVLYELHCQPPHPVSSIRSTLPCLMHEAMRLPLLHMHHCRRKRGLGGACNPTQ